MSERRYTGDYEKYPLENIPHALDDIDARLEALEAQECIPGDAGNDAENLSRGEIHTRGEDELALVADVAHMMCQGKGSIAVILKIAEWMDGRGYSVPSAILRHEVGK